MAVPTSRRPPPPLNAAALDRLALRYVERFATTRAKLTHYLARKIRERGWEDSEAGGAGPDVRAIAERMAQAGYVDDRGYAEAKGAALGRRGMGSRRVADVLRAAGVAEEDAAGSLDAARADAWERALTLARRRRIGPFAATRPDPRLRERQLGQLLRAGHDMTVSRRLIDAEPGQIPPLD